ncbi:hypothetical protein S7711_06477 [Stachybotrys chartarum IBT 7711]|uniref:Uncharacterized protein n=1 Tax=Stachybotrys chartarum (strain CBS 109288 / IBT 7711) TaxID=1280523 RepID=A0A084AXB6_STACB|nr:hypothetical protein S7711_06477 [Stachybotrys chartarum IBT 7711]KFA49875.1 hypothetical protein S40293_01307 [Stachybotrys chartarum IBT 40293]
MSSSNTHLSASSPPSSDPPSSSAVTAQTSIPSHPAPKDAAAVSSGVATDSRRPDAADRAMSHTNEWKPSFERRQSWNKEDQKRALQMTGIDRIKTGPGFTERS